MRTKVFQSGNSQAVRIPKAFRFDVDEVEIFRCGDEAAPVRRIAIATPSAFPYSAIQ